MPLWFGNPRSDTVYIALLTYDSGCHPNPWRKSGWYGVAGGGVIEVVHDDLRTLPTPYFAWFADLGADGPCWSGSLWYKVPHNAGFSQCYDDDTGCNALWPFRLAWCDPAWSGMNIVLSAPGEPNQANQGYAPHVLLR
jgi:hypothetical protein